MRESHVEVTDDYELDEARPVTLSCVTPCLVTAGSGSVAIGPALLSCEGAQVQIEELDVSDDALSQVWPDGLRRVLLHLAAAPKATAITRLLRA